MGPFGCKIVTADSHLVSRSASLCASRTALVAPPAGRSDPDGGWKVGPLQTYELRKASGRHPRQMDGMPERLLDQIETVDQDADAAEPAALELGEMRDAQRDRLVGFQRCQRIAHHRAGGIDAEHDGLAVKTVDAEVLRDLLHHLDDRFPAAPRAEEGKHVDGSIDRPIDVVVEYRGKFVKLAFVDRTVQRARKTPEAVLCHV